MTLPSEPGIFVRSRDRLNRGIVTAEQAVTASAAAMVEPTPDPDALRRGMDEGWTPDEIAALRGVVDRVEITSDGITIYSVASEPFTRTRASLQARCNISGCGRVAYTKGLCKSHVMRARKVSEKFLDEVAVRASKNSFQRTSSADDRWRTRRSPPLQSEYTTAEVDTDELRP